MRTGTGNARVARLRSGEIAATGITGATGCATMTSVYDGPPITDVVNPAPDEIWAWAYSGATEPMQDWNVIIAEPDNLPLLVELVADLACPSRRYILRSLYCAVGHGDRTDRRLHDSVVRAQQSDEPWLNTWARRVHDIVEHPESFQRQDWGGCPGYAAAPTG